MHGEGKHGIPRREEWVAGWIEPAEPADSVERQRPAYYLAGELVVEGDIAAARIFATAHGIYELFLNDTRVGDQELTPGFTAYRKRVQVQSFDVTPLLRAGRNAMGALLSDGWWRGQNGVARRVDDYGSTTAFLAQLHVLLKSGGILRFGTDATWRSHPSHILGADLIAGEVHDLRLRIPGWAAAATDRHSWSPVRVASFGYDELCEAEAPAVRRIEALRPRSIRELGARRWVVDFGQNVNGWVRLAKLGNEGTRTTLTYGEALGPDGDVTQDNIAAGAPGADAAVSFQTDTVVSAGTAGDVFEPRHSTKGFQFVRVEGDLGELTDADIASIVVHTDFTPIGSFACSDERLNAIHRIADWSFRGNACDIPTDCPTRERSGWTGDWQIYIETAAYLYDIGGFTRKWLRDLAADQLPSGAVTNLVPEPHPMDDREPVYWKTMVGSAGWGDAAVHVPWVLYRVGADAEVLATQWRSMVAWVEYAATAAASGRHPSRIEQRPQAAKHETYLWDTGFHFGEWLEPGQSLADSMNLAVSGDHAALATAYLFRSATELAAMAKVLGRHAEEARYAELAHNAREAWRLEFLDANGSVTPNTQANLVRALAFELLPSEGRGRAVSDLVAHIRAAGTHLGTGFLSTPFLLPVLAEHGHLDLAYELLLQDTPPSWRRMILRGATTIWEEWDGIDATGAAHASLNHYSKGAVISFLHQFVAGLRLLEPGYRRFRVAPHPGAGVTSAQTHHDAPFGRIEVAWRVTPPGQATIEVGVPPGTEAELVLPDGSLAILGPGKHQRHWDMAVTPP